MTRRTESRTDSRMLAGALAYAVTIVNEDPSFVGRKGHTPLGAIEMSALAEQFAQRVGSRVEGFDEDKFVETFFTCLEFEHEEFQEHLINSRRD